MHRNVLPLAGMLLIAACASGGKATPQRASFNGGAVIAEARNLRADKGCMAAIPAYRVAAGIGEGYEAAQHELGECLLTLVGAGPVESALIHEEALFWLKRAAFAGNARAQRALALDYGTGDNPDGAPAEALKWALLYEANGDAKLYGFQALPPTFVPGLEAALSAADIAAAEQFAASFSPITMTPYRAAPAAPDGGQGAQPPEQGPSERQERRPRRR